MFRTVEHILDREQATSLLQTKLEKDVVLLDYFYETYQNDDVSTQEVAENLYGQLQGTSGQFQLFTREAIDAIPGQMLQDMLDSAYGDDVSISDSVATATDDAFEDGLNGSILTYNEVRTMLPYFDVKHLAPISDNVNANLPSIVTNHSSEPNLSQEQFSNLSDSQQHFLVSIANTLGHNLVVDSTEEFARGSEQYRESNQYMQDPYDVKNALSQLFDLADTSQSTIVL